MSLPLLLLQFDMSTNFKAATAIALSVVYTRFPVKDSVKLLLACLSALSTPLLLLLIPLFLSHPAATTLLLLLLLLLLLTPDRAG
jgi:hypothetical protein